MKQLQQVTFSDLTKEKPAEIPDDSNAASDNIMGLYWASQALFVPLEQITEVNVKKAYHQLSLLAHPDKNPGNKSEATSAMAVLSKAKAIFESHLAKKKVVELKPEEISRNRAIVLDLLALHNDLKGRNGDFTEKNLFIEDILSKMAGYDVRQEITDQLIKQAIEKNKSSFKELSDGFSDRYKFSEKSSVGGGYNTLLASRKLILLTQ